jgi:hypothetical protein
MPHTFFVCVCECLFGMIVMSLGLIAFTVLVLVLVLVLLGALPAWGASNS